MAGSGVHGDAGFAVLVDKSLGWQRDGLQNVDADFCKLADNDQPDDWYEASDLWLACFDVKFADRVLVFANPQTLRPGAILAPPGRRHNRV